MKNKKTFILTRNHVKITYIYEKPDSIFQGERDLKWVFKNITQ